MANGTDGTNASAGDESNSDAGNTNANVASDNSTNGASDPAAFVRTGRGRHPGNCACDKCTSKRAGGIGGLGSTERTGSGKSTSKSADLDLGGLATQLQGVHKLAAMLSKNPIWEITDDESKKLAQAIKGVLKHHNIPISPVMLAYLQLAGIGTVIYAPRVAILIAVKKMQAEQAAQHQTVSDLAGGAAIMVPNPDTPMQ